MAEAKHLKKKEKARHFTSRLPRQASVKGYLLSKNLLVEFGTKETELMCVS